MHFVYYLLMLKKTIIDMFHRILFLMKSFRQSNDILENKNKYIIRFEFQ